MQISENADLLSLNTFHLEAYADRLIVLESLSDVLQLLPTKDKINILGGGSNVLFTKNPRGDVWLNRIGGIEIIEETETDVLVRFGSGELWHHCVQWCIDKGFGGIENLSLIPGTIGAAPMQNIGAYGVELKDVFHSLEAIHLQTKEQRIFYTDDCDFGYRESVFKHEAKDQYIIVSVTLNLSKQPQVKTSYGSITEELQAQGYTEPYTIKQVSDAVIRIRQSKLPDPAEVGNAGSFFKNPVIPQAHFERLKQQYPNMPSYPSGSDVKIPAAWLIEQCGWKGFREGDLGVHAKQALVLVNYHQAKGEDILRLSEKIMDSVWLKFDIALHREVNIW